MQALLQNIDLRQLRMILLGAGIVLLALIAVTFVLPPVKAYRSEMRVVSALEQASESGAELEAHLRERNAEIEDLRFRLHGDMANLPVKQVESFIIGRLQKISWQNDVDLISVRPADGEQVQIFREILFNVQLTGSYEDLYRWLWEARNELGFVVVKEYGLTRRNSDDENPLLMADLSLASYRVAK